MFYEVLLVISPRIPDVSQQYFEGEIVFVRKVIIKAIDENSLIISYGNAI